MGQQVQFEVVPAAFGSHGHQYPFALATPNGIAAVAGDPERRGAPTTALADLARRIEETGVRALPDGIRVDDTRYDTVRYADAWPDSYRATGQVGPVGALTVDGGWNDPAGRRGTPAWLPTTVATTSSAWTRAASRSACRSADIASPKRPS